MRKILPYIIALIFFIGLLNPLLIAQGQATWESISKQTGISVQDLKNANPGMTVPSGKVSLPFKNLDPSYHFLEPLPGCKEGTEGCENGKLVSFDPTGEGKFGTYLNFAIELFIGLCAVAAVLMLVIAGVEYSSSELISTKAAAIERIKGAVFGLVLALASWTLLYTINPDLLNVDVVDIDKVTLEVTQQDFQLSAAQLPPGATSSTQSVITNEEACSAAKRAESTYGVDRKFLMAMFFKESRYGKGDTGTCGYSKWERTQQRCFDRIAPQLGLNKATIRGSCAGNINTGGGGGAIGYTQFQSCTLEENLPQATAVLGRAPNLWSPYDALVLTAIKAKKDGGNPFNVRTAVRKYFGACSSGSNNYCDDVENYIKKSQC